MDARPLALRYGRRTLELQIPAHADILDIREPHHSLSPASFRQDLAALLPAPLPAGEIAIVVADKTRLCGYPLALPWLLEGLLAHGIDRERIVFYIAYGNHAPQSEAESLAAYGQAFRDFPFVHHCSTEPGLFTELGVTRQGTPVRVRRELLEAGLIITMGAISHHYFAGFGGGRKLLFPGLGEQEAIGRNHQLFLDLHGRTLAPGCRPGRMEGNPLAEDLAEIDRLLPPYLAIHGLLDSEGEVVAFRFGRTYEEFLQVCQEHDHWYRASTGKRYDLVLASAGGYPKDINLIQTHKAIDNAAGFVRDHGTLILLAECPDGIGSTTFLPFFKLGWEAAFDHLADHYSGNGGTALAMMAKTRRITISLLTSLDHGLCAQIGITRIGREEVMERLNKERGSIAVIKNSSLLIRAEGQ